MPKSRHYENTSDSAAEAKYRAEFGKASLPENLMKVGGTIQSKSAEDQAKSKANNSREAFAKAQADADAERLRANQVENTTPP